jgi:hypothetical protein
VNGNSGGDAGSGRWSDLTRKKKIFLDGSGRIEIFLYFEDIK